MAQTASCRIQEGNVYAQVEDTQQPPFEVSIKRDINKLNEILYNIITASENNVHQLIRTNNILFGVCPQMDFPPLSFPRAAADSLCDELLACIQVSIDMALVVIARQNDINTQLERLGIGLWGVDKLVSDRK